MCLSVVVHKLQVAIRARSSREMSQTVRRDVIPSSHEFASQFGLANLLWVKNTQKLSRKSCVMVTIVCVMCLKSNIYIYIYIYIYMTHADNDNNYY